MTIYFDNAATSWPKPDSVMNAMISFNNNIGSNPGRSGHHLSVEAGRTLYEVRENAAELFNIDDPLRISLTSNITHSLNIILRGYLKPGDHVITSSMEHNSVMRPLRDLEKSGIELSVINCDSAGILDPDDIKKNIRSNTKLFVLTHASNVTGTIMPVVEAGRIASEHGILFCLDSAQTAGVLDIDVKSFNIVYKI
jgi:selenocysteine lyase/cysteine desulfurase